MKRNQSFIIICLLAVLAGAGCQKLDRPGMPDYPEDQANPGGALNFFTAFEGTEVDSILANFGQPTNAAWEDGISGKAYKGGPDSYIKYPSANNFSRATSFTISFWLKKSPHPPGSGAEFVFVLPTSTEIWHMSELFLLIEDGNQSTAELGAFKLLIQDQWFEFVGANRLKNVLDNQWHHFAFTYDESTSKLTTYIDGTALTGLPAGLTDVKKNGNPRGPLSFTNVNGFVIGGGPFLALGKPPVDWMVEYTGSLDQFRLYNKALTAAEIQALFNGKQ
ncbi:LamG domain-containing protein [Pseudoflavitalea rhizosphaerae]|uniref:LamG domain-containing protein n=1 Tax=Pseudoflavitalea rhizosphaerae TaxID=1884793 RepID=UPI000F8E7D07|nr:LamG domain-containing protein [Pseudoflavitalea rhizosphaerae]